MIVEGHVRLPGYAFFESDQVSEAASQHIHPQQPCGSPWCVGQQPEVRKKGANAGHMATTSDTCQHMGPVTVQLIRDNARMQLLHALLQAYRIVRQWQCRFAALV